MCAGTACFAQVTAGRTGHPGPGQARVQLPAGRRWSPTGEGVLPSAAGSGKREGGVPAFPLFSTMLPLSLPHSPSRSAGSALWPGADQSAIWASKPEAAQGQPIRGQRPGQAPFWGPEEGTRTSYPHALYPVPISSLTLSAIPSISHHQQRGGAVV